MLLLFAAIVLVDLPTAQGQATSGLSKKSELKAKPVSTSERAVYTEPARSSTQADSKLKWRPVRPVNHEEKVIQTQAIQPGRPAGSGLRSVLAHRQATQPPATPPATSPTNDPFGDASLEPDAVPSAPPFEAQPGTAPGPFSDPQTPAPSAPNNVQPREPANVNAPGPFETDEEVPMPAETPSQAPAQLQPDAIGSAAPFAAEGCVDADREECLKTLKVLKESRLADIGLDIRVTGDEGRDYPCECPLGVGEQLAPRLWASTIYTWKASALCHKPLYFEDVQLERYGHSRGPVLDPVISAAHFFVAVPTLPYRMGVLPPNECVYTLGYYRPGNCAPYLLEPIPISPRGALFQAGAIAGVGAIVP